MSTIVQSDEEESKGTRIKLGIINFPANGRVRRIVNLKWK